MSFALFMLARGRAIIPSKGAAFRRRRGALPDLKGLHSWPCGGPLCTV